MVVSSDMKCVEPLLCAPPIALKMTPAPFESSAPMNRWKLEISSVACNNKMRNFFIGLILLVVGVKYGAAYLLSDDFQAYANRTKAPWTCQFENGMGHFY